MAHRDLRGPLGLQDLQDRWGLRARSAHREFQVPQDLRAPLDRQELKDRSGQRGRVARKEFLVLQDLQGPQERTGPQGRQDLRVTRAHRGQLVQQALPVRKGLWVLWAPQAQWVQQGPKGLRGL